MIVKIGKYPDWWGPYQITGLLRFFGFSEDKCDSLAEKTPEKIIKLLQWFHDTFRQRKVKIKIHDYDTWNLNSTAAMIIHPMLVQLKKNKHGCPNLEPFKYSTDAQFPQLTFDFYYEGDNSFEVAEKEWETIMDKMIFAMYEIANDNPGEQKFFIELGELDFQKYPEDEGKITVPVRWKKESKIDMVGLKKYEASIQEGCELFGKYFQNLWD